VHRFLDLDPEESRGKVQASSYAKNFELNVEELRACIFLNTDSDSCDKIGG